MGKPPRCASRVAGWGLKCFKSEGIWARQRRQLPSHNSRNDRGGLVREPAFVAARVHGRRDVEIRRPAGHVGIGVRQAADQRSVDLYVAAAAGGAAIDVVASHGGRARDPGQAYRVLDHARSWQSDRGRRARGVADDGDGSGNAARGRRAELHAENKILRGSESNRRASASHRKACAADADLGNRDTGIARVGDGHVLRCGSCAGKNIAKGQARGVDAQR